MRKCWTKVRPKPSRANNSSCNSVSGVWDFRFKELRWFCLSSFAVWNKHLSVGMLMSSVCSPHWQVNHDSRHSKTVGSPLLSFTTLLSALSGPPALLEHSCKDFLVTSCISGSLKPWRRIYTLFSFAFFMPLNLTPLGQLCQVQHLDPGLGWTLAPLDHTSLSLFFFFNSLTFWEQKSP